MYDQTTYNKDFQGAYIVGGWIMLKMLKWKKRIATKGFVPKRPMHQKAITYIFKDSIATSKWWQPSLAF
jgi:hypothetical protein